MSKEEWWMDLPVVAAARGDSRKHKNCFLILEGLSHEGRFRLAL